jgi:AcrR family transcriptional regulator
MVDHPIGARAQRCTASRHRCGEARHYDTVPYHNFVPQGNTVPYHKFESYMTIDTDGTEKWIAAAMAELAEGGVDRVRVEVVAERLGVTKGGFYRRFEDRRALLDAILDTWSRGRVETINKQTASMAGNPRDGLRCLIELYSRRVNVQGMAIELAIRQWARSDRLAAQRVAHVDAHRLKQVEELYRRSGLSAGDAQARAVLFYSFIFGQSLLVLELPPRKRASLLKACADALTSISVDGSQILEG